MATSSSHKRHIHSDDTPGPSSFSHTKKKTRFVSPSQDPANFEAQVEDALENPSAARKGRVKTEGYDSDSSDDGEGVVLSRRKGEGAGDDDDDVDMFAAEEDEQGKGKGVDKGGPSGGGKKKKEEFMRLGDIEGQEFHNVDGDSDDDEDDAEPVDEDEAERRRKAGMGFELSKFNMREEMEEGRFSADGMYVRTFDPHAVHDRWMDDVDDRDMKKARRSMKRQLKAEKERERKEAEEMNIGKEDMEKELVGLLRKGESVLEALARLGVRAKKEKTAAKANGEAAVDDSIQTDIDRLTTLSSALLPDNVDIYSATYESLLRGLRSKGNVEPDWVPPKREVKYEYRWALEDVEGGDERQVFGPFGEEEMRSWYAAAYFGPSGEKIDVRQVGKPWGDWEEVLGQ